MDPRILDLDTAPKCSRFSVNALAMGCPDLAAQAQRRSIHLRALELGAQTALGYKIDEAVVAYEDFLTHKTGKKTRAGGVLKCIRNRGRVGAVEHLVNSSKPPQGFIWLCENGMHDLTFEAVVLDNIDDFSDEAVYSAMEKLEPFET